MAAARAVIERLEGRQLYCADLTHVHDADGSILLNQSPESNTFTSASSEPFVATPAPLSSIDVGSPGPAGSTTVLDEDVSYDVTAGGSNISGNSDAFRYLYRSQTGDFDVKVQVDKFATPKTAAKAGIMARESLAADSRHVFSSATSNDGYRLLYRLTRGGDTATVKAGNLSYPNVWVRLARQGNNFTAYRSADGVNWTAAGTITLALPSTLYLGLESVSEPWNYSR